MYVGLWTPVPQVSEKNTAPLLTFMVGYNTGGSGSNWRSHLAYSKMSTKKDLAEIMDKSLDYENMLDDTIWQNRIILFILRALYKIAETLYKKETGKGE